MRCAGAHALRQYHLPFAKPPNAINPINVMIKPIQKLQTIIRTIGFGIARKAIWSGERCAWLEAYPVLPGQNPAVSAMCGPDPKTRKEYKMRRVAQTRQS